MAEAKKKRKCPKPIKKLGKPPTILDEVLLHKMASEDCTVAEIAAHMNCARSTIYENYADVLRKGRDDGNSSLKRRMFEVAMSGNVTMLVWLSKQRLGYKDQQPIDATQINFNVYTNELPVPKTIDIEEVK